MITRRRVGRVSKFVYLAAMSRITTDPEVMGGRPCVRGIRMTVGTIVGLVSAGHSREEILRLYPYLEAEDIDEALAYRPTGDHD
jgi:uncharacterized protein (DUF433 family)